MVGKYAALATPILALAAIRVCSAARMSGRRSSSAEGSPGGTAGGWAWAVKGWPRGTAPGGCPRSKRSWFSVCSIRRCESGMTWVALYTNCSAWRRSNNVPTPPCRRTSISCSDCWRDASVRWAIQFLVQFAQGEIGCRDVAHERREHRLARIVRGKHLGPRRFGGAAQPAPHIDFERHQIEQDTADGAIATDTWRDRGEAVFGRAHGRDIRAGRNSGELRRPGDAERGARLVDPGHGSPEVVIRDEGSPDQGLELLVFEDVKPVQVPQRCGVR